VRKGLTKDGLAGILNIVQYEAGAPGRAQERAFPRPGGKPAAPPFEAGLSAAEPAVSSRAPGIFYPAK